MLLKLVMLAGLVLIGIWDILVIVCGWIVERATEAHSALNKDGLTVVEPTLATSHTDGKNCDDLL